MPYKNVEKQREASRNRMRRLRQRRKAKLDQFQQIWDFIEKNQPFYFPVLKEKGKIKEFGMVKFEEFHAFFKARRAIGANIPSEVWMCKKISLHTKGRD